MSRRDLHHPENQNFQAAGVERQYIHNFVVSGQENQDEGESQVIREEVLNRQEFHEDRGEIQEIVQEENVDNMANQIATDSQIEIPVTPPLSPV